MFPPEVVRKKPFWSRDHPVKRIFRSRRLGLRLGLQIRVGVRAGIKANVRVGEMEITFPFGHNIVKN